MKMERECSCPLDTVNTNSVSITGGQRLSGTCNDPKTHTIVKLNHGDYSYFIITEGMFYSNVRQTRYWKPRGNCYIEHESL